MIDNNEKIRNNIIDTILAVLFLLFVISFVNYNSDSLSNSKKNNISTEMAVRQANAITNTNAQVTIKYKTPASEIKYPEVKNPGKMMISENRKTENQISIHRDLILKSRNIPLFIFHLLFFQSENDGISPIA